MLAKSRFCYSEKQSFSHAIEILDFDALKHIVFVSYVFPNHKNL